MKIFKSIKNDIAKTFLFIIVAIFIIASYRYNQYILDGDFILNVNVDCEQGEENCFDPSSDSSFGDFPYKKVEIFSRNAPKCLEEHTCGVFSCEGIKGCSVTYCSDETNLEGESCFMDNTK